MHAIAAKYTPGDVCFIDVLVITIKDIIFPNVAMMSTGIASDARRVSGLVLKCSVLVVVICMKVILSLLL